MSERKLAGEVIIAENGALKTFASYYEGHLNLDSYANMGGEHVWGFTGPETRIVSKKLIASRTFEVVDPNESVMQETITHQEAVIPETTMEPDHTITLSPQG
jgi:hypothetical protein